VFKSDLEHDIANEQNGDLGRLFRSLISATRPSSDSIDFDLAKKEAQELYDVCSDIIIALILLYKIKFTMFA